ncbi:MAG TPA: response regulator transcription factor [Anaerolineales bacterium]|nr:response regulator transcription factor [Anaerolineales bacterium]
MDKIKLVVVDDHPIFRQGVIDSLSLEPDFAIIGEATNGEEALEVIRQLGPDVAVIDVNLPGMNGQQVTRQIVAEKLPTRVVLLTAYDDTEQKLHAMRVGAAAYCVKDVTPEHLAQVVHTVFNGGYMVGEQVFDQAALERWVEPQTESAMRPYSDPGEPFQALSKREMEVLAQLTHGLSNKEIATELGISHQTVKNHVTSILRKLGVEDRTQAAIYALRRGWVRLHEENKEALE